MVRETIVNEEPCVRCGSKVRKKELGIDSLIDYIEICITCGHENVVFLASALLALSQSSPSQSSALFKKRRLQTYNLGLKKYRRNDKSVTFQGSPADIAQKNLASAVNCIKILAQNVEMPDEQIIETFLEKVFLRLEKLKYRNENIEVNESELF